MTRRVMCPKRRSPPRGRVIHCNGCATSCASGGGSMQARFGTDRVVDMPLAEGVIVGSSVGLAVAGRIPIAEIQFLGFTHQAFHQISDQVARMRMRSRGRYGVPLVI